MKSFLKFAFITLSVAMSQISGGYAQQSLPVIHAGSKSVSIQDGRDLSKYTWNLDPQLKPDTYYVQVPKGNRKISFITDKDSISFVTEYGKLYDFIIVLNKKDSCLTRISANYNELIVPQRLSKRSVSITDTIPFFMKDSRIYFQGKLNGKADLDIMFDLGAGMTCLNVNSVANSGVSFDGEISIKNTDGTNTEASSSRNRLEIGGLKWDSVPLVQVRNLDSDDDMIIGNSLFRDKIIEIDYERKVMIMSDRLNKDLVGYSAHHVSYYQDRPRFEMEVKVGGQYYPFHFLFDTGRDGTMLIGEDFTDKHNLWAKYQSLFSLGRKKIVVIPEIKIGNKVFREIVTNANDPAHPNGKQSLIGNEILSQFNVVLDNQKGRIYLKPNSLQNENYATYSQFKIQVALVMLAVVCVLLFIVLFIRKRKSKITDRTGAIG